MRRLTPWLLGIALAACPARGANQTEIVIPATTIAFGAFTAGVAAGPQFGGLSPFRRGFCQVNVTATTIAQTMRFIFQTAPDIAGAGASPNWTDYAATDQLGLGLTGVAKVRFTAEAAPTQSNTSGALGAGTAVNGPFGGKFKVLAIAGANPGSGSITFVTTCLLQD